ncbi:unnamed protein product [Echinostoma caproni]|uniref:Uncharacterized protein n=1 Tax=Echinostoma caproni TaxID=27848 RepID=A0A183B252_9TREM|nr:unnamed protein product [Echinostoma caproni]
MPPPPLPSSLSDLHAQYPKGLSGDPSLHNGAYPGAARYSFRTLAINEVRMLTSMARAWLLNSLHWLILSQSEAILSLKTKVSKLEAELMEVKALLVGLSPQFEASKKAIKISDQVILDTAKMLSETEACKDWTGGKQIDEKLKMRTAVNLTRLQSDEIPHISPPKRVNNLSFAPLVASTPDASFTDTTSDEPTIVGILNRKVSSAMKLFHAPAKLKVPTKVPNFRPPAGMKKLLGNLLLKAASAFTLVQTKSYSTKPENQRQSLCA